MTFPDADGLLFGGLSNFRSPLADKANPASAPIHSAPAGRESDDYGRYISSVAWKTSPARLAELRAAGHRCRLCFASVEEARLEVHHRTYRNWRCERAEDLTTLCHDCHLHVTSMERARKYARFPVLPPSCVPVAATPPLFDYRIPLEIV